MNKQDWLKVIPVQGQRQDSAREQLADLVAVANKLGMYDAADAIRQLYDTDALATVKYGCHVDLEEGIEPDECVIDRGDFDDCVYARPGMRKEQCKYWKIVVE